MELTNLHEVDESRGGGVCGHNRESPPSFCNGLGTIYIASSRGITFFFILLPDIWVQSLGMVLGRC